MSEQGNKCADGSCSINSKPKQLTKERENPFLRSLIAGGMAGFSVDVLLYPLDTVKTRLQSSQGFIKAGGFKGIYSGLSVAAIGSVPGAALFFSTYETMKYVLPSVLSMNQTSPMVHMMSGGIGEIVACLVRVPTDVIKQRYQAKLIAKETPIASAAAAIYREHGLKGFYNGYFSTILREIPFSFIQFPLYEKMKRYIGKLKYDRFVAKSDGDILCNEPGNKDDLYLKQLSAIEAALCGSVSGAIAAALTTPLDVVKTRLMLGGDKHGVPYRGLVDTVTRIQQEAVEGMAESASAQERYVATGRRFFAGVSPRVMWISIGGFIFFGAYEQSLKLISYAAGDV